MYLYALKTDKDILNNYTLSVNGSNNWDKILSDYIEFFKPMLKAYIEETSKELDLEQQLNNLGDFIHQDIVFLGFLNPKLKKNDNGLYMPVVDSMPEVIVESDTFYETLRAELEKWRGDYLKNVCDNVEESKQD